MEIKTHSQISAKSGSIAQETAPFAVGQLVSLSDSFYFSNEDIGDECGIIVSVHKEMYEWAAYVHIQRLGRTLYFAQSELILIN